MGPGAEMTEFEKNLLRDVVELYIETGRPVSSKDLKSRFALGVSTAKIRGILHELEEKGLLFKPHVSAGRIPSDTGYRHYVDSLIPPGRPGVRTIEEIRHRMGRDLEDVRQVMSRTSRLLGELTNCMGLMVGSFGPGGEVERLEMVQLEGGRALVLLRMEDSRTRRVNVELGKRFRPHIIDRAARIMNERLSGHPLAEAHARLMSCVRDCIGREKEIAGAVAAESDYLFGGVYEIEYYFRNVNDIEEAPELRDPEVLRSLVSLMGRKNFMISMMRGRMGMDTVVTIGRENRFAELRDFSVVTTTAPAGDLVGLLGVIGPTRMSYRRVLALLDGTAAELSRL